VKSVLKLESNLQDKGRINKTEGDLCHPFG